MPITLFWKAHQPQKILDEIFFPEGMDEIIHNFWSSLEFTRYYLAKPRRSLEYTRYLSVKIWHFSSFLAISVRIKGFTAKCSNNVKVLIKMKSRDFLLVYIMIRKGIFRAK